MTPENLERNMEVKRILCTNSCMKKAHILISRGLAVIGDTKPVLDLVKAAPTDSGIVEFNGVKYSFGFTYRDQLRKPIPESEATWETYRVLTVRREDEND